MWSATIVKIFLSMTEQEVEQKDSVSTSTSVKIRRVEEQQAVNS